MSETSNTPVEPSPAPERDRQPAAATPGLPGPEDQKQRWFKYGANVVLTVAVVVVLGVVVTAVAESRALRSRVDTTEDHANTLKPQTVSIIRGVDQKIRLVGLYPHAKNDREQDYYGKIAAILSEYQSDGHNITAEMIDPVTEAAKVDQLIADVSRRGGGEEKRYAEFLDQFENTTLPQIDKFGNAQYAQIQKAIGELPRDEQGRVRVSRSLYDTISLVQTSVQELPDDLEKLRKAIHKDRAEKIPDYKGAVDEVRTGVRGMSQLLGATLEQFAAIKTDAQMPPSARAYAEQNQAQFEQTKKVCDDLLEKMKGLGELKALDELRQDLKSKSILVLGEKDMKVVPFSAAWRMPENRDPTRPAGADEAANKLRFAGEQPINAAILALTARGKTKVAFVRAGGTPLTTASPTSRQKPPLSTMADRLRQYNFEILENDATGMAALQAQMGGGPPPTEATEEQIKDKDVVWVVVNSSGPTVSMGGGMMGPGGSQPNPLGPKVAEHLKAGGSVLVMFDWAFSQFSEQPAPPDNLAVALRDWGVEAHTDTMAVHERLAKPAARPTGDPVERAQRVPFIFVLNRYGDHPMVKNLNSLDALLLPMFCVQTKPMAGFKSSPLIPIPQAPRSWGETNWETIFGEPALEFHEKGVNGAPGDLPNSPDQPLYAGAAVEKDGGGRLVVLGSAEFAYEGLVSFTDPAMDDQDVSVLRFPGNGELFTNSVFWLAHKDAMLALSPAATQVKRIGDISPGKLSLVRIFVLIGGLPAVVLAGGAFMHLRRRGD